MSKDQQNSPEASTEPTLGPLCLSLVLMALKSRLNRSKRAKEGAETTFQIVRKAHPERVNYENQPTHCLRLGITGSN